MNAPPGISPQSRNAMGKVRCPAEGAYRSRFDASVSQSYCRLLRIPWKGKSYEVLRLIAHLEQRVAYSITLSLTPSLTSVPSRHTPNGALLPMQDQVLPHVGRTAAYARYSVDQVLPACTSHLRPHGSCIAAAQAWQANQ